MLYYIELMDYKASGPLQYTGRLQYGPFLTFNC
jgi:hypothetical protein